MKNENPKCEILLGNDICPLGPSKKVKSAVRKALKTLNQCHERKSIKRIYNIFSSIFGVSKSNVLFANSLGEILRYIPTAMGCSKVTVVRPERLSVGRMIAFSKAHVEYVELDELESRIDRCPSHGKVFNELFILSNPNRITGSLVDNLYLERIADLAQRRSALIIIDQSLIDFAPDYCSENKWTIYPNIVRCGSSSNFYGLPGLGLSWAIAPVEIITSLRVTSIWDVNSLAIEACIAALKDGAYRRAVLEFIYNEKILFHRALCKLKDVSLKNSEANVFVIDFGLRISIVRNSLQQAGYSFALQEEIFGLNESLLMMSVMSHDLNKKLISKLRSCLD